MDWSTYGGLVIDPDNAKDIFVYSDGSEKVTKFLTSINTISTNSHQKTSEFLMEVTVTVKLTIQLIGSVDDAQSGLTPGQKYYVQEMELIRNGSVFE